MHDRHQVLREFLLWTERLSIHDDQCTRMHLTQVLDEREPKAGSPIFMRNHQGANLTSDNAMYHLPQIARSPMIAAATITQGRKRGKGAIGELTQNGLNDTLAPSNWQGCGRRNERASSASVAG